MALLKYQVTVIAKQDAPYNVLPNTAIAIRKVSDDTLVQIYSDEAGLIPIPQPGATTDSRGVFEFYADSEPVVKADWTDGVNTYSETFSGNSLQVLSGLTEPSDLDLVHSRNFKTVSDLKAGIDASGSTIDMLLLVGSRVFWRGYYAESDGGSNWGIVKTGAHTDDGGSIFSIDANTYVEANLSGGQINVRKFGAVGDGVTDDTVAIQAALDYPARYYNGQNRSTTVFLPFGIYSVSNLFIKRALEFKGSGHVNLALEAYHADIANLHGYFGGSCLLARPGTVGKILRVGESSSAPARVLTDYEFLLAGVTVRDMGFAASRLDDAGGIDCSITRHNTFDNLVFYSLRRGAMHFNEVCTETNVSNIITHACGSKTASELTSYPVFDFNLEGGVSTPVYNNNFNFNNIITVFNYGDAFQVGGARHYGTDRGINGLRVSNWYNHGMIAIGGTNALEDQFGTDYAMTTEEQNDLTIVNLDSVGNVQFSNCQLSITGSNSYQVRVTSSLPARSSVRFSNCTFGGWFDSASGHNKSIYTEDSDVYISSSEFTLALDGAYDIRGDGTVYDDSSCIHAKGKVLADTSEHGVNVTNNEKERALANSQALANISAIVGADNVRIATFFNEEGAATSLPDSSIYSNDATIRNSAGAAIEAFGVVANKRNYAQLMRFGGDYFEVSDSASLNFGDGVTDEPMTIIVAAAPTSMSGAQNLFTKKNSVTGPRNRSYALFLSGNTLKFDTFDESAGAAVSAYSQTFDDSGKTGVYIATKGAGTTSADMELYRNGAKMTKTDASFGSYTAMEVLTANAGCFETNASGIVTSKFSGDFGFVMVAASKLTDAQVLAVTKALQGIVGG